MADIRADANSSLNSSSSTTLGTVTVVGRMDTDFVPNPLANCASSSYTWTLWWLDLDDYNEWMAQTDVDLAMAWEPGQTVGGKKRNSYVIAEDAGIKPNGGTKQYRYPGKYGDYNYNIQNVNFKTTLRQNSVVKSSGLNKGSMQIVEPYGVTLINYLLDLSMTYSSADNYVDRPYMLQLDFTGYDDEGKILSNDLANYKKRFPIQFTSMKLEVGSKGTVYNIDYVGIGSGVFHNDTLCKTQDLIEVKAGTVDEFFTGLEAQINKFNQNLADTDRATKIADVIKFEIDDTIKKSKIVNNKQVSYRSVGSDGYLMDLGKTPFTIAKGTDLLEVVNRIMSHSDYMINQVLFFKANPASTASFFGFRTQTDVRYSGSPAGGGQANSTLDASRGHYPKQVIYKIRPYEMYSSTHPGSGVAADPSSKLIKQYQYIYTGRNDSIIDFKLNFNYTFYNPVLVYPASYAEKEAISQQSSTDKSGDDPDLVRDPVVTAIPLSSTGNPTPMRYRPIFGNQNITHGMNILERPDAQRAADAIANHQGGFANDASMIMVDLTIIGDPTLIKQDDWAYIPSPITASYYNGTDGKDVSEFDFASKYGSMRMDRGEVPVYLEFRTPIDQDPDTGLVTATDDTIATFSGVYFIIFVENKFNNGMFTQVLRLARQMNNSRQNITSPSAVNTTNQNLTNNTGTNGRS